MSVEPEAARSLVLEALGAMRKMMLNKDWFRRNRRDGYRTPGVAATYYLRDRVVSAPVARDTGYQAPGEARHETPASRVLSNRLIKAGRAHAVHGAAIIALVLVFLAAGMIVGLLNGRGAWAFCFPAATGGNDNITCFGGTAAPDQNLGAGDDVLTTVGTTTINDDVNGEDGNDTVNINGGGTVQRDVRGGDDIDTLNIIGTVGRDVRGDNGNDVINISGTIGRYAQGDNGDDLINMTGGSVLRIRGGNDNDTITVSGGTVSERINGNDGNDNLFLNGGTIALALGGGDDDTITVDGATITGDIRGGGGSDIIDLISLGGPIGSDLEGNGGNDTIIFRPGVDVSDITGNVNGGGGTDTLQFEQTGTRNLNDTDGAKIINFEHIDIFGGGTLALTDTDGNSATPILNASGTIDLQEGTLDFVNANSSISTGTFTSDPGTTVSGNGTINAASIFNGNVDPGGAGVGALNITGTAAFGADSITTIHFEDLVAPGGDIDPINRGTEFDVIDATGAVTINGGATLIIDFLSPTSTVEVGDVFDLVTGSSVAGDFSLIATPGSLVSGAEWEFNNTGTAWQVLLVEDVPEPASLLLLPTALGVTWRVRRRRLTAVSTKA